MIILLAVLALVVVNALADSPWGTFSLAMTIPIALFMGFYLRVLRPGPGARGDRDRRRRCCCSRSSPAAASTDSALADAFTLSPETLALCLVVYGFVASVLPVWMLLAAARLPVDVHEDRHDRAARGRHPRDAAGDAERGGHRRSPATATGPVFAGALFPFVFITIACGALSGFHALIASGTTPKMIEKETPGPLHRLRRDADGVVRRRHGDHRRLDHRPGPLLRDELAGRASVGDTVQSASQVVNGLGFAITPGRAPVGGRRRSRRRRSSPAPAARRRSRSACREIFAGATGGGLQGLLVPLRDHVRGPVHPHHGGRGHPGRALHAAGHARQRLASRSATCRWKPGLWSTSAVVVGAWGYFLYVGVTEPARRHQPAVPAVRHRQPAAGRGRADGLHDAADQARQAQVGLGDRHPAGLGRRRHADRELPEGVLRRPEDRLLRAARHVPGRDRRGRGARRRRTTWTRCSRSSPTRRVDGILRRPFAILIIDRRRRRRSSSASRRSAPAALPTTEVPAVPSRARRAVRLLRHRGGEGGRPRVGGLARRTRRPGARDEGRRAPGRPGAALVRPAGLRRGQVGRVRRRLPRAGRRTHEQA